MRRSRLVIVGIVGVAAVLVPAALFMFSTVSLAPNAGRVQVATSTIAEETSEYKVKVEYPQFGISTIDTQIKRDIEGAVMQLKNTAPIPPDSAAGKNSLDGTFDRTYVGPDVISVELILSFYTGGAHGSTLFSGANYDRSTGERLGLSHALALIGKTVQEVSAESSAQLKRKLADNFIFPEGANTNPENFSSFLISEDSVTFIFQQYQVAAYAYGPQEVTFKRVR